MWVSSTPMVSTAAIIISTLAQVDGPAREEAKVVAEQQNTAQCTHPTSGPVASRGRAHCSMPSRPAPCLTVHRGCTR
eukprot:scaffold64467_cov82-Phaeocystis_antarctica.AAC.1